MRTERRWNPTHKLTICEQFVLTDLTGTTVKDTEFEALDCLFLFKAQKFLRYFRLIDPFETRGRERGRHSPYVAGRSGSKTKDTSKESNLHFRRRNFLSFVVVNSAQESCVSVVVRIPHKGNRHRSVIRLRTDEIKMF